MPNFAHSTPTEIDHDCRDILKMKESLKNTTYLAKYLFFVHILLLILVKIQVNRKHNAAENICNEGQHATFIYLPTLRKGT